MTVRINEEWYWRLLERVGGNKKSNKNDRKERRSRVGWKEGYSSSNDPITWRGTGSIDAARTTRA